MTVLLLFGAAQAQQSITRYYISSHEPNDNSFAQLVVFLIQLTREGPTGTGLVTGVYYPQFGVSAVVANLSSSQRDQVELAQYDVRVDQRIRPNANSDWPLNQWSPLPATATSAGPTGLPVVYVIDSGINSSHTDFVFGGADAPLVFDDGASFGYNTNANPPVLRNEYTDPLNHGTRVAGCLGGKHVGLLGALGGRARVKSINIYDFPQPAQLGTFASQAIQGILHAVTDHQARKALPYLRNHASILLFAHSTEASSGRMAALDQAVETAWKEGLHVVLSAGNDNVPAARVSPAGAAWGYRPLRGSPVRFWDGLPPLFSSFYRAEDEFLVVGASQLTGNVLERWPQSNTNAVAEVIDFFTPGIGFVCPSGLNNFFFHASSGTSMSAGFGAAIVAWMAHRCPWARPSQVRQSIRNSLFTKSGLPTVPTAALPPSLSYYDWIEHYYPPDFYPPSDRSPVGDPDGDGVVNFVEYHCGQDPRFSDAHIAPEIVVTPGTATRQISVRLPRANYLGPSPQVTWELQLSHDLKTWSSLPAVANGELKATPKESDAQLVTYIAAGPPIPTQAAVRIKFTATLSP